MPKYQEMSKTELQRERAALVSRLDGYKKLGLKLTMARGVPAPEQLDLSQRLLSEPLSADDCVVDGIDTRTYGCPDGPPRASSFAELLGVDAAQVIVGGSSSST